MAFDYENYIKTHFHYDADSGKIYRDDRKNSLGSLDKDGYLILKIKGKQFKYHRVVWLLCKGYFPNKDIDHIDRNRVNNRIENLREVTREENIKNTLPIINNDTGERHIYVDKSTKGLKAIYVVRKGKETYRFRSLEKAIEKRNELWNQFSIN